MTHAANKEALNFGTGASNDGESIHSGFTKVKNNFDYLFALADQQVRYVATTAGSAALEDLSNVQDGEVFITRGYATEGDGGGNVFWYDSGSSQTCNGGTILDGPGGNNEQAVVSNSTYAGTGTGRFKALDPYRITARQFGCNTIATENRYRLAAAATVSNLELIFDANTDFAFDSVSSGIDITVTQHWIGMPGSQISVGGSVPTNTNTDGTASRFVIQANKFKMTNMVFAEHTSGNASTLTIEADDFEAVNCHFNDNANGNLPVVLLYSALRPRFRGCRFTAASTQSDAELVRVGDPNSTSGKCEDVLFADTYWDGVYGGEYGFSSYAGIRLCDVEGFTMLRSSYEDLFNGLGLRVHGTMSGTITDVVIAECVIRENSNYFQGLVSIEDSPIEGLLLKSNVIKDYSRDLCYITEGNDISILDNVCGTETPGGTNYPISVRPAAAMDRLLIDGNYSRGGGIQVNPASGGQIDDVTISNNFCARIECNNNNSLSGVNNRLTIEGNTVKMGTDWSAMSEVIMVDGHSAGDEWQTVRICNNHMHSDNAGDDLLGTEHLIDVWVLNNTGSGSGNMTWENATAITDLQADQGNAWNSREITGTAAPTGGTWAVGDRVWNETPTAGGTLMWVCTTAGTPGTWKTVSIDA